MATITHRPSRKKAWLVQIRLANHPAESRSFPTEKEAKAWARIREGELSVSAKIETNPAYDPTLEEIVAKYEPECHGYKSYSNFYKPHLGKVRKHHIGKLTASRIKPRHLEQLKKHVRRQGASEVTVKRAFYVYRRMFRTAQKAWGIRFPHL